MGVPGSAVRGITPIERILTPFQRFARTEAAAGVVLLVATMLALAWANSPWSDSYAHLREVHLGIRLGGRGLDEALHTWINDGLMAIFFLVVGLPQTIVIDASFTHTRGERSTQSFSETRNWSQLIIEGSYWF